VKRVFCNCCGREMNEIDKCGIVSISQLLGYGSKHDGVHVEVDICAECFDGFIEGMKIKPALNDRIF